MAEQIPADNVAKAAALGIVAPDGAGDAMLYELATQILAKRGDSRKLEQLPQAELLSLVTEARSSSRRRGITPHEVPIIARLALDAAESIVEGRSSAPARGRPRLRRRS